MVFENLYLGIIYHYKLAKWYSIIIETWMLFFFPLFSENIIHQCHIFLYHCGDFYIDTLLIEEIVCSIIICFEQYEGFLEYFKSYYYGDRITLVK